MGSQAAMHDPVAVACSTAPGFREWFAGADGAIAISTYQAGKVALIGWVGRRVTLLMRQFDKPLGLTACGNRIVLAARHIFGGLPVQQQYEKLPCGAGRREPSRTNFTGRRTGRPATTIGNLSYRIPETLIEG